MDAFQGQCTAPAGRSLLRSMLIAEDDGRLTQCLARAMEARGFQVMIAGDIVSALQTPFGCKAKTPEHPMSPASVRLQHIQQVHEASGRNVSETARRLNMHRRTLQRILGRWAG